MRILRQGSTGPAVQQLQLALNRAGFGPLDKDGIFGIATKDALIAFQQSRGLVPDGAAGTLTHQRLLPWYVGYVVHRISPGDTFGKLASEFGTEIEAIRTANLGFDELNLRPGAPLVIPLPFDVVPTDIAWSSALVEYCVRGLSARYPFLRTGEIGRSVMGRSIWSMTIGHGANRVMYNASHHANEWITTPLLFKFTEELSAAYASGGTIYGISAANILAYASIRVVPAVNPDGIDLVTGELTSGRFYDAARDIAARYPQFSFPSGWKANISGVDLNLQYPAGWEQAREIKYAQGIVSPAPADFVGEAVLTAPESVAMYDDTKKFDPALVLAYHTQGEVIYWRFLDYMPVGSADIARVFSSVSGYGAEDTPYASGFAGYKDWFIQDYDRPGYTIEAGLGVNPLPIEQFDGIYRQNLGILTLGAVLT